MILNQTKADKICYKLPEQIDVMRSVTKFQDFVTDFMTTS